MAKTKVKIKNSVCVGFKILDINKIEISGSWYDYIKE